MIQGILQHCYTNLTKEQAGSITSGWQGTAVSPEMSDDLKKRCVAIQAPLSQLREVPRDENGRMCDLSEFVFDGKWAYFIRTRYGLVDRLGRANLFSHALTVDADAFLSDPNLLLSLLPENFKAGEEEALSVRDAERDESFTLASAMETCGLTEETLYRFVSVVYFRLQKRTRDGALYVQAEEGEREQRALLYLLAVCLPKAFLARLKAGSVDLQNSIEKTLVFTKDARKKAFFVVPRTGEQNVLSDREKLRVERALVLPRAFEKCHDENAFYAYYRALESRAETLGTQEKPELLMKLAIVIDEKQDPRTLSDAELEMQIGDALRTSSLGNREVDGCIYTLLSEQNRRSHEITAENEDNLFARYRESTVPELRELIQKHIGNRLQFRPFQENLSDYASLSPYARECVQEIYLSCETGRNVIDRYYADIRLSERGLTFDKCLSVFWETKALGGEFPETVMQLLRQGKTIGEREILASARPLETVEAYEKYLREVKPGSVETESVSLKSYYMDHLKVDRLNEISTEELSEISKGTAIQKAALGYAELRSMLSGQKTPEEFFQAFSAYKKESPEYIAPSEKDFLNALFEGHDDLDREYYLTGKNPKKNLKKRFFAWVDRLDKQDFDEKK